MSLGSNLAADIEAVFNSEPASSTIAAQGLAQAYYDYVSGALFGASVPVITTAMRDAMASTLDAGLSSPGAPPIAAGAYSAALAAFWLAVPVAGGAGAGVTAAGAGAAALAAALAAVLVILTNTKAGAAAAMAAALTVATATVVATLTLPPGGPIPYLIG